jgi:gas vesicle protein
MTAITLNITADLIQALLATNGPDAKLAMQQEVVTQVAKLMLKDYKEDMEDRVLRDEVLDEFCAPAKDYWTKNNATLLDNFREAIRRQVKAGVDQLIRETFNEKMKEVEKTVADYAKALKEVADESIKRHITEATDNHIQEKVAERLRQVAAQIA